MRWKVEPPLSIIASHAAVLLLSPNRETTASAPSWHPSSTQTLRKGAKHEKTYCMGSKRPSIRVPNRPPMVFAGDPLDLLLPQAQAEAVPSLHSGTAQSIHSEARFTHSCSAPVRWGPPTWRVSCEDEAPCSRQDGRVPLQAQSPPSLPTYKSPAQARQTTTVEERSCLFSSCPPLHLHLHRRSPTIAQHPNPGAMIKTRDGACHQESTAPCVPPLYAPAFSTPPSCPTSAACPNA